MKDNKIYRIYEVLKDKYTLSSRNAQVMAMYSSGLTAKELGDLLYITDKSVKFHITKAFKLLGVKNGRELAALVHSPEFLKEEVHSIEAYFTSLKDGCYKMKE